MTFGESIRICMGPKYLFCIKGRASRSEYWWFTLFTVLLNMAEQILAPLFAPMIASVIILCISLALLPPGLGVSVRRLHDINLSGWWLLLPMAPILLGITLSFMIAPGPVIIVSSCAISLLFLILFCKKGTPWPNRYGDEPGS